jgi:hypothetical protein
MPSELQRVAQGLVDVLDEVPRVVAYLQRIARQCRENAALVGGMSNNPAARMAAIQLDEAARRCDEAAHYASLAPRRARVWAEEMVSGARVAERSATPGAKSRDAPAGDRERIRINLRGSDSTPGKGSADDRQTIELSTSNPDHLPVLSAPPANAMIRVDDKFIYDTDDAGRVISARAVLDLIDLGHPRDTTAQRGLAGKLPGDHAGHIFARIFRGPIGTMNLLPMQGTKVNLSQYKTLENHWRRLIQQGESIDVSVSFKYTDDSTRPDTIRVRYKHADGIVRTTIDNKPKRGNA